MPYEVRLRRPVQRQLDRLPMDDYVSIAERITSLEAEPRPRGAKKLAESGLWRIRQGPYRIVYAIDDEERLVVLVRVARRREGTYRGL
jgi:mRNA interferase RelE/StbE